MAVPRPPSLYPNLMRAVRSCEPTTYRSIRISSSPHRQPRRHHHNNTTSSAPSKAGFHTSRPLEQETFHRRYGPAAEPTLPPPSKPKDGGGFSPQQPGSASKLVTGKDSSSSSSSNPSLKHTIEHQQRAQNPKATAGSETPSPSSEKQAAPIEPESQHEKKTKSEQQSDNNNNNNNNDGIELILEEQKPGEEEARKPSPQLPPKHDNPLEEVLHMPSPSSGLTPSGVSSSTDSSGKPIHLTPGRYVHHFDTYSLVQDLSKGGFTNDQSVTIMKAVRNILQSNLSLARSNLVSKSDVENESYLFKAACSELQSSLQTARNAETQRQRSSRTQLQHEEDILSQRLNQELAGLKDDIKGMFNDHKMTTRELQRSINTSIQELNYKITISLNSDGKSTIEGLRWIVARRAALAIATSAFMIILFLKYYSLHKARVAEQKAKDEAAAKEAAEARATKPVNELSMSDLSESLG